MKVTVLIENTACESFQCEHGLSMLIEYKGKRYLLDAGKSDLFLENAALLQAPIYDVEACVLSHGHYDHSGGFGTYLTKNPKVSLYMMETALGEFYSASSGIHEISIPKDVVDMHRNRFQLIRSMTQIGEDVYLVPHDGTDLSMIGSRAKLYRKVGDTLLPDDFSHELSLVFDTAKGLVIFNSCSHGGPDHIIQEVQNAFPGKEVYAFLGGLHMKGGVYSEEEIAALSDRLKLTGLKKLFTGHCTGAENVLLLKQNMGECVLELRSGQQIDLLG